MVQLQLGEVPWEEELAWLFAPPHRQQQQQLGPRNLLVEVPSAAVLALLFESWSPPLHQAVAGLSVAALVLECCLLPRARGQMLVGSCALQVLGGRFRENVHGRLHARVLCLETVLAQGTWW